MSSGIRTATSADVGEAAATLAAAFDTYPWTRWSLPDDGYEERLERLQAIYLAHAIANGVVLVCDDLSGVAALLPPGSPEPTEHAQRLIAEIMGDHLDAVFGLELPPRLESSWDLATVGVRPSRGRRGLGSALIAEALQLACSSAYPRVSLETSSPSNVALYERHGFVVTHRTEIEDGPVVFTMGVDLQVPTPG